MARPSGRAIKRITVVTLLLIRDTKPRVRGVHRQASAKVPTRTPFVEESLSFVDRIRCGPW